MGLIQIKKDLSNLASQLYYVVNDGNTVLKTVSQCTDLTLNSLYYPCSKFNSDGVQVENACKRTSKNIMSGLEILLKDLASEINEFETLLKTARKDSKKVKQNAQIIYELALFDVSIEGFLEYDMSIERDIQPYLESITQVVEKGKRLQQQCNYWNNQLIVKVR